ncbi:ATP-binding cassette domain-containing protein [Bowmanella dokdonensis]|uniref:ABC transporter ATP-binding protein n=1 Tax=Bowmanella dokdonensis TaxID=751969 RepID=A0A939DQ19_9ALTE|nr:ABC transporter ATP-binding protein [Bowmanella dokdonensis]
MTECAIDVKGLCKSFSGRQVVSNVDISMPKGEVWGFLGPNGSGKTTTIRMICGLLEASAGEGTCLGYDIRKEARKIKELSGYMTQHFSFWQDLSVRENLQFVARLYNLSARQKVVQKTLDELGLGDRQDQLCGKLSGGWKQRLALAAVTMHKPQLLLLDEPTAGVDPQARRDFWDEIHRLTNEGVTVLVSTHYMDEAERCDQIVYLAHGKVLARGTVDDVIAQCGLITFQGKGENVRRLADALKGRDGIEHVAYFGTALHVSGRDRDKLKCQLGPFMDEADWQEIAPSLEDTFIDLMKQAGVDKREHG